MIRRRPGLFDRASVLSEEWMAINVEAEIQIARPKDDVAAYVVNPENDAVWIGGIRSAHMLTEPPVGVGTKVARVASFMGKRIEYAPEVVAYEPGSSRLERSVRRRTHGVEGRQKQAREKRQDGDHNDELEDRERLQPADG